MIRARYFSLASALAAVLLGLLPDTASESVAAMSVPAVRTSDAVRQAPDGSIAAVVPPSEIAGPRPAMPSAEVVQLRRDLDQIARTSNARNGNQSILVVSLEHGDTLYSLNPDLPLAPASNMKLFSTAAALYYLGPSFRYSTYALADGEIRDGTLYGDLILYGTGDPAISSRMLSGSLTPLRALADSLVANGIREITGSVVGDGSYFDDQWIGYGWKEDYRLNSYSAPVGALSLAENVVSIRVLPGAAPGGPAEIRTTPATSGLMINNQVRTVTSGGSSIRFAYDPGGLVIRGQIMRGHPGVARSVAVTDPANYAAAAFRSVLEDAGVRIGGDVRTIRVADASPIGRDFRAQGDDSGSGTPPRVIGTHLSPTLQELTTVTNHVSQNLYAEALFKTVGRVVLGEGSFLAGARAVQYFLDCEEPFDFRGIRFVDGSGLSPENRITTRATIHLLDLMNRTEVARVFHESLPLAASPNGGNHSLRSRMGGTPAAHNLRAKTGTISNVSSLSGYVRAGNGELLAFSIFVNDVPSTWQAKRMEDAVGARLARFTRSAPPAASTTFEEDLSVVIDSVAAEPTPLEEDLERDEPAPADDQAAPAAPAPIRTHRVTSGQTMDAIARRYGVTVADLQRANPSVQPRRLQIGQVLVIPRE